MNNRYDERVKELYALGLKFDFTDSMVKDDINVHTTEITCDTDEEWNKKIESIKQEIERRETA